MTNSTYYYAMPNATTGADLYNLFGYVNDVSGNIFMPIFFGIFCLIVFIIGINTTRASVAFAFTAFLGSIMGMFLATLGFLAPSYMYLAFLALAGAILWLKFEQD